MSDTKWGFDKHYAHRVLPSKWQSAGGYTFYEQSPFDKKSFRMPKPASFTDDVGATDSNLYIERKQTQVTAMSSYGVHREMPWTSQLRSPVYTLSARNKSHTGRTVSVKRSSRGGASSTMDRVNSSGVIKPGRTSSAPHSSRPLDLTATLPARPSTTVGGSRMP